MARMITNAALDLIKKNEGLRLRTYFDVAGIATIGYGHTPASQGQVITEAQATALLLSDIAHAADAVTAATAGVATNDNQYSAMVSLAFNIGTGAFKGSSVLRMHRAGDHNAAANAFLMWDKAHVNGQLVSVAGLARRRAEEQALYLAAPVGVIAVPVLPAADAVGQAVTVTDADAVATIKTLQQQLAALRRYKGDPDGICGPQTAAAAMAAYNALRTL